MNPIFPYRYRVLIFLFSFMFITYLDRISIGLLGKRIISEFHLSNEQFGWVLSAFSIAYAIFEIPAGIMGDRKGQKIVLIRIVVWWSLFTALTGITLVGVVWRSTGPLELGVGRAIVLAVVLSVSFGLVNAAIGDAQFHDLGAQRGNEPAI